MGQPNCYHAITEDDDDRRYVIGCLVGHTGCRDGCPDLEPPPDHQPFDDELILDGNAIPF